MFFFVSWERERKEKELRRGFFSVERNCKRKERGKKRNAPTSSTAGISGSIPSFLLRDVFDACGFANPGLIGRPCTAILSLGTPSLRARAAHSSVGTKQASTRGSNQVLWHVVRSVTTVAKGGGWPGSRTWWSSNRGPSPPCRRCGREPEGGPAAALALPSAEASPDRATAAACALALAAARLRSTRSGTSCIRGWTDTTRSGS